MKALNSHRFLQLAIAGIAMLLSGRFFAPEEARAACGDYVTMGAHAASAHSDSHEAPKPCSGPMCSNSRQPLPLAPAPTLDRSAPKAVFLALGPDLAQRRGIICRIEDSAEKPIRHAADILRPPCR
jgi:hypothetical protein